MKMPNSLSMSSSHQDVSSPNEAGRPQWEIYVSYHSSFYVGRCWAAWQSHGGKCLLSDLDLDNSSEGLPDWSVGFYLFRMALLLDFCEMLPYVERHFSWCYFSTFIETDTPWILCVYTHYCVLSLWGHPGYGEGLHSLNYSNRRDGIGEGRESNTNPV